MTDKPRTISITDFVVGAFPFDSKEARESRKRLLDTWYWCRRCNRAEHFNWAMDGCVRVGPFESENVAASLALLSHELHVDS